MDKLLHEMVDWALSFLLSLVPPALGAIVSLFYEPGLTWSGRAARLWVGVTISYFVGRALGAVAELHPYVLQAIAFLLGLVAYRAAPAFAAGVVKAVGEAPAMLRDRLIGFLPTKKDSK